MNIFNPPKYAIGPKIKLESFNPSHEFKTLAVLSHWTLQDWCKVVDQCSSMSNKDKVEFLNEHVSGE